MGLVFSSGAPSDDSGVNGDYNLDTTGRFFYGPKANGTWANVPLYSLQGPSGPGMVYGVGAPAANQGAVGQGYTDLVGGDTWGPKTALGWGTARTGAIVGAQGVAGPSGQTVPSLNSQSFAYGPAVSNATALALSGNLQPVPTQGGTQPGYFVPMQSTTLQAAMFVLSSTNSPGATTFYLLDATAGQYRYSYTINTAGTVTVQNNLGVGLVTGNTHQWMVSGSGNAFVQVMPMFLQPSSQSIGASYVPTLGAVFSTAPTAITPLPVAGATGITAYMPVPKTGFLFGASFVNTANSSATFYLYNQAGTVVYSTTVSNNQNTPASVGPFGPSTAVLPAGNYTWRVQCNAPGYFAVQPQIFI